MKILSLNISDKNISISYFDNKKIYTKQERKENRSPLYILDVMKEILPRNLMPSLNLISFGYGPGTFMGTRLASSIAQGLSMPNYIPIMPVSNLHAYAYYFRKYFNKSKKNILIINHAYKKKVYFALFKIDRGIVIRLSKDNIGDISELKINKEIGSIILIGNSIKDYEILSNEVKSDLIIYNKPSNPQSIPIIKLSYLILKSSIFNNIYLRSALPLYLKTEN